MRTTIADRISQAISIELELGSAIPPSMMDDLVRRVMTMHNGWYIPNLRGIVAGIKGAIKDQGLDHPGRLQRPYDITWPDITFKNLIEKAHAITFKADGIRTLLALSAWGSFLITGNLDIIPLNETKRLSRLVLLDGELVGSTLWLFDSLVIDGMNMMAQNLEARRSRMEILIQSLGSEPRLQVAGSPLNISSSLRLQIKPQIIPTDTTTFFQAIRNMIAYPRDHGIPSDGLILTGIDQAYSQAVYKWKPPNLMSVDFFILPSPPGSPRPYTLATLDQQGLLPHPELVVANVVPGLVGSVAEFQWHRVQDIEPERVGDVVEQGQGYWSFSKSRPDKATPNAERVYQAIQRLHQDPITLDVIQGQSLRLMRKYHNRIKRQVYSYLASQNVGTLVDVGSGKGGDLGSWKEHDLEVEAIEPNRDNAQELMARAQSMDAILEPGNPTQILGDHWNVQLYQRPVEQWINVHLQDHTPSHALTLFNVITFLGPQILCTLSEEAVRSDGIIVIMVIDGKILYNQFMGPNPAIQDPRLVQIRPVPCPPGERFGTLGCIAIRLVDSATVTQEQVEGLIDVDVLLETMRQCGWSPDLDTFLDKELLLGPEEAAYSSAQRLIILRQTRTLGHVVRPIFAPLGSGETRDVESPWGTLIRVGIPGPGSQLNLASRIGPGRLTFIHALLQASDPRYQRLDPIGRILYVSNILSSGITIPRPTYLVPGSSWDLVSTNPDGRVITYPALRPSISHPPGIVLLQLDGDYWEPLAKRSVDGSLLYIW